MRLRFTDDVERYARAAIPFLDAAPAERNVLRTVLEQLRSGRHYGDTALSFWWVEDGSAIAGAAHWTPPFPLLLSDMPAAAAEALAAAARERSSAIGVPLAAVTAPRATADVLMPALAMRGYRCSLHQSMLLQVCRTAHDVPVPPGHSRFARDSDADLLARWLEAFAVEARTAVPAHPGRWMRDMIGARHISVWDVDGTVTSVAGDRDPSGGVVRIGPVYTPPEHRSRGYARRLVQEITAAALQRPDVSLCSLFADAANPVSNGVYAQIGYVTVGEHVELAVKDLRTAVAIGEGIAP